MTKKLYITEYNSHPSISCGNISEQEKESVEYKRIRELVTPIFDKALKEKKKNRVSVGGSGTVDYSYAFYNPHNARFYFKYLKTRGVTRGRLDDLEVVNSSELCNPDFMGCRVVVKKHQIEVTNKIDKERRFKISGSLDEMYEQTVEAVAVVEREAVAVLKEFCARYGFESDGFCVKVHIPDNKILHDRIIDSLPADMTFRNEVVKKVYKELPSNIELSSPAQAANTFRNLALHDFAPMIASELESIRKEVMKSKPLVSPLESVKMDIVCFPDDIFKHHNDIVALSDSDKGKLSDWTFEMFGGLRA